jgi:hypothetical protein
MDYAALFNQGIYSAPGGINVFAGTTDDAFWIDLGAAFDTFNLRTGVAPVRSLRRRMLPPELCQRYGLRIRGEFDCDRSPN